MSEINKNATTYCPTVGSISLVFCMEIARHVLYVIYFFLFRLGISVYNDVLALYYLPSIVEYIIVELIWDDIILRSDHV